RRHRIEVRALALGAGSDVLSGIHGLATLPQRPGRTNTDCEWVAPSAERNAPLGHRAGPIALERGIEGLNRPPELERVEQRDGAIEHWLCGGAAGRGEVDRPELLVCRSDVLVLLSVPRTGEQQHD